VPLQPLILSSPLVVRRCSAALRGDLSLRLRVIGYTARVAHAPVIQILRDIAGLVSDNRVDGE
jgi:hypothetical protein